MALLSKVHLFRGLRAVAKKLRRRQSPLSLKKRPQFSSSSPHVDHSTSSSSSSTSSSVSSSSYRNDIRRVFAEYDADGDGRISLDDLTRIVTAVAGGGDLSASDAATEAAAMMEVADLDREGYIGFQEFQTLMMTPLTTATTLNPSPRAGSPQHASASVPLDAAGADHDNYLQQRGSCGYGSCDPEKCWAGDEEDIRLAFAFYDHDGDGVITAHEIHAVLRRVMDSNTITLADCKKMVHAVDRDGDGVVGFHDFAMMMR